MLVSRSLPTRAASWGSSADELTLSHRPAVQAPPKPRPLCMGSSQTSSESCNSKITCGPQRAFTHSRLSNALVTAATPSSVSGKMTPGWDDLSEHLSAQYLPR